MSFNNILIYFRSKNHHQKIKAIIELKNDSNKGNNLAKKNYENINQNSIAEDRKSKHEVPTTSCCRVNENKEL